MTSEKERRKIIKVGEASYAVTIPKRWCRELGIDVGDVVELEKHADSIILYSPKEKKVEEPSGLRIALDASRRNVKQIVEEVIGAYIEGVSEVHVKGKHEVIGESIKILRKKLPGLVVLPGLKGYSYKLMFMEAVVDIVPIIEKLSSTLNQMFDIARKILLGAGKEVLELSELKDLEEEAEGIHYLGLRVSKRKILQESLEKTQEVIDSIIVLRDLKEIAYSVTRLAGMLAILSRKGENSLVERADKMITYLRELYEAAITSYLYNDINKALIVLGKEEVILKYVGDLLRGLEKHVPMIAEEISPIIRNSMNIARLTVSKCIRDKACRCRFFPLLE